MSPKKNEVNNSINPIHSDKSSYKNRSKEYLKRNKNDYKCLKCDFTTISLISVRSHYDKEHSDKLLQCEHCPFETTQQYYFNSHVKFHLKPDLKCPHCKKFIKAFSYRLHIKIHQSDDQQKYKCNFCNYQSYQSANVKRHTLTKHTNPEELNTFNCNLCDYITVLEDRLKRHKKIVHTKEGQWLNCNDCDYKTQYKIHLNRHINNLHSEKTEKCTECLQLFSSKEYLKYHIKRKHSDETEKLFYYCEMCPKESRYKTTEKGNLARHILAHKTLNEIEVFSCHKCPYLGKTKSALKTHLINAHLPELHNYKCNLCGYSTNTKSRFNSHVKIVHAIKQE